MSCNIEERGSSNRLRNSQITSKLRRQGSLTVVSNDILKHHCVNDRSNDRSNSCGIDAPLVLAAKCSITPGIHAYAKYDIGAKGPPPASPH